MRRAAVALALATTAACGTSATPTTPTVQAPPEPAVKAQPADPTGQAWFAALAERTTTTQRATRSYQRPRPPIVLPPSGTAGGDIYERLAMCESGMRQVTPGPFHSYFQWTLGTYHSVGGEGMPEDHDYSYQRALAEKLVARSGWGQFPACSRKLGLR